MLENGYIKLYRSMLGWEWYSDVNTRVLFIHLLLTANYEPEEWRGNLIKRGQRACSRATLAQETRLSEHQIRTALSHLKLTKEITSENIRVNRSTCALITILKYDEYQSNTSESPVKLPVNRQSSRHNERKKEVKEVKKVLPPISPKTVQSVFNDFKEMRKGMRKPMTEKAVELAMKRLEEMAPDEATRIAIIEQSIERGWTSFYPLKAEQRKPDKFDNLKRLYEAAKREEMQGD